MMPAVGQLQRVERDDLGKGVSVQRLIGRQLRSAWCTDQLSVSLFELQPDAASDLGHNKEGQESFIVIAGRGSIIIDDVVHPVEEGSFVTLPPASVRSVRADHGDVVRYYALTTPAWRIEDNVPDAD